MEKEQERRRAEHVKEFGSFLLCPKRECLCVFMEESVQNGTKCIRRPCILDDPENIELMKIQEQNRMKRAILARRIQEEEERALIRNQSRQGTPYEQRIRAEIHRLEKESEKAFRNNNPNRGHTLFNRSRIMRGELKEYLEKNKQK